MELGEKLRSARMDAGLTQKQLCEGIVTRNMLSQIENGTARPSMATLTEFARRLGKSVSYFLEDTAVVSPNTQVMTQARQLFDSGEYARAAAVLESYREPDGVYDREKQLMEKLCILELASQAIRLGRLPYAGQLLKKGAKPTVYCAELLERERLLLLGQIPGEKVSEKLPSLDRELLLRAKETLGKGDTGKAAALLDACTEQESPRWKLLRGKIWLAGRQYRKAAQCLLSAEKAYPGETAPMLEVCFRELGDYRRAYEYACKQKK